MKRKNFFILILSIIALLLIGFGVILTIKYFKGSPISLAGLPLCTDSDGGQNYFKKGTVTAWFGAVTYTDYCYNKQMLVEYYCWGASAKSEYRSCTLGCENGACRDTLLTVLSPKAGEKWETGKTYPIIWEVKLLGELTEVRGNVAFKISLYSGNQYWGDLGISDVLIASGYGRGVMRWTIPPMLFPGDNFKIVIIGFIEDRDVRGESGYFSISNPSAVQLPDLVIRDIWSEKPYIKVSYCNIGATESNETFLIKLRNENTGKEYGGNPAYRFSVPLPGECKTTGGFSYSLLDLKSGQRATLTGIIDWENRVRESNENNNTFTKQNLYIK